MDGDTLTWLLSATAFAVSMAATPGPNNAMVAASGATWGFARTLPHMLGVTVGFAVMIVAVALGAAELLRAQPWIHDVLRWAGAAYLLWLAVKIARARPEPAAAAAARTSSRPMSFLQGALFQWVNPKAWVIAVGAVVTYTTAGGAAMLGQTVVLATIFLLVTLPALALWTGVGVGAARVLRSPRALRAFNLVMAALLVVSLLPLLREGAG